MEKEIYIVKANGDRELFDPLKLETSLKKAGADPKTISTIVNKLV